MPENTNISYQPTLEQAGLSAEQAVVYEFLLRNGSSTAGKIAEKTPFKRGLVYKVLDQLTDLGLVVKKDLPKMVAKFEPAHPLKLKELAERRAEQARTAQSTLGSILERLTVDFNLLTDRPGFRFYEGIEGLKEIYDDVLLTGKDFMLFRSIYEPTYNDLMLPIVKKFIQSRVRSGIKVTAFTPIDEYSKVIDPAADEKVLMTRVVIPKDMYTSPVEIDVYGDKLAILSYGQELVGLVIQSPQIAQAISQAFNLIAQFVPKPSASSLDKPSQ